MNLPDFYETIFITYNKSGMELTERGFLTPLYVYLIPPEWVYVQGILIPQGENPEILELPEVIKWEYENEVLSKMN